MSNPNLIKSLDGLARMFGKDRLVTPEEVDQVLGGILLIITEAKKETQLLNTDTKKTTEKLLGKILDKYQVFVEDMRTLKEDVSDVENSMLKRVDKKIEEVKYLLEEAKKLNTKEEKLEIDDVVQAVLESITLPETKEMLEINGERMIDLINETEDTEENKISWKKIKDVPDFFTTPQTKKGKLKEGGMSPTVLRQAVDLDHSTRADGYGIVWSEALGKHIYSATGGGGGGSGTVNSGSQYRLAYYATAGTAVSQAAAITAARVLISDANGVPTHSTVTSTTLAFLDATSSVQTQLNTKLSSVTGTSNRITISGGSTIDIASTYVGQSSITTLGTIATGVWNGTAIGDSYISSAATWNAKQSPITTGSTNQYFRGDLSLATFPTALSAFTNDSGFITSSALTGYALLAGTLAQFASTTSAQLASIMSDETGSGALVFATSPTIAGAKFDYAMTPAADDTFSGEMTNDILAGDTIAQWDMVYLDNTSGRWEKTDADAVGTAGNVLLAMAAESGTDGNAINVVFRGIVRNDAWAWTTKGAPLFLSTTASAISETAPTGEDDVVRIVGHVVSADCIYLNPSANWIIYKA